MLITAAASRSWGLPVAHTRLCSTSGEVVHGTSSRHTQGKAALAQAVLVSNIEIKTKELLK